MRYAAIGFLVGGVLGLAGGALGMLLAFPFLFPPAEVNETVAAMAGRDVAPLVESRFREGVAGQDAAHWGRGGVRAYRSDDGNVLIELQPDFEVGPGPNFWIYLNARAGVDDESDFEADAGRQRLAKLKSFTGSQVYAASGMDFDRARAITIWCESFGQYIASADIEEPSAGEASPNADAQGSAGNSPSLGRASMEAYFHGGVLPWRRTSIKSGDRCLVDPRLGLAT